jgi:hypothetical protein
MSIDELLSAANQLSEPDLEILVNQVLLLRARRKAPVLPAAEAELLVEINQGVPPDLQQRYQVLAEKRDAETLTETEYQELLALSDRIEILAAQRVEALAKLAQLRQVSLLQVMDDLGIASASYA